VIVCVISVCVCVCAIKPNHNTIIIKALTTNREPTMSDNVIERQQGPLLQGLREQESGDEVLDH